MIQGRASKSELVMPYHMIDTEKLNFAAESIMLLEDDILDLIEEETEEDFDELDDEIFILQEEIKEAKLICDFRQHFKEQLNSEIEKSAEEIRKLDEEMNEIYRFQEAVKKY